ncbi:MAG: cysteine desulfurase [Clostridia bacterium]|nr:cysteine desulfurase [Clostridia bacterium]
MIYLDYPANTPADPAVVASFADAAIRYSGNPNAKHPAGCEAKRAMDETTAHTAALLGVLPEELIFTSGASESNNTAIKGLAHAYRHVGKHIITTPLEHPSVSGTLTALQERGYEIDVVNVTPNGQIDLEDLQSLLRKDTVMVTVCAVDSELGMPQPLTEIKQLLTAFPQCKLHIDYTQAMGKIPVDLTLADTAVFSPHKFYGLNGCGVLYKKKDVILEPLIHGGAGSTPYRSGTPAVALAVSADVALTIALEQQNERMERVTLLHNRLTEELKKREKVRINSPKEALPHVINLSVAGVKGAAFRDALAKRGVCVSVKSACSVENTPSRAVFAVSGDKKNALSSWRIGLSHLTSEEEITEFLKIFDACYEELKNE